jgi:hypothetical protein
VSDRGFAGRGFAGRGFAGRKNQEAVRSIWVEDPASRSLQHLQPNRLERLSPRTANPRPPLGQGYGAAGRRTAKPQGAYDLLNTRHGSKRPADRAGR